MAAGRAPGGQGTICSTRSSGPFWTWRRPARLTLSLSGGLDSALLAALLARAGRAGRAFTLDADYDASGEAARAAGLCARLGLEHVRVPVREHELPERFEDAVRAAEAPLWNGRAVASLLFFERCRAAGVSTLVSGCGADDVLCGQPEALRSRPARARRSNAGWPSPSCARAPARRCPRRRGPPGPCSRPRSAGWRACCPSRRWCPSAASRPRRASTCACPTSGPPSSQLALALPEGQRVRDGWGKWLLRRAAELLLPHELCWQPKQPRLAPAGGRSAHARRAWGERLAAWLTAERLEALQVVEPEAARALFERQAGGELAPEESEAADALLLRLAALTMLQPLAHNPQREE